MGKEPTTLGAVTEPPSTPTGDAEDLVIAYAFAPYADPSAVAATKTIAVRGLPVDVVQHDLGDLRRADATLASLIDPLVRRRLVTTGRSRFSGWRSITDFCEQGEQAVRAWAGERADRPYRTVWSRAHFIASHVLAALVRDAGAAEHWVAEFSDVITRSSTGGQRDNPVLDGDLSDRLAALIRGRGFAAPDRDSTYAWALTAAFACADELVFTTEAQRDALLDSVPAPLAERARERSTLRPHATLPADAYTRGRAVEPDDGAAGRVRIGYFGNLYAAQSADALFTALGALPPAARDRVRLTVHTGDSGSPLADIRDAVAARGLDDVIDVQPTLPFLDFLATAAHQDVLLALDAARPQGMDRNPVLLSKLSDYLGTDVPIWAVVDPRSPLDEHPSDQIRYRSALGDAVGAAQVLSVLAQVRETAADPPAPLRAVPRRGLRAGPEADTLAVCFAFTPYRTTSGVNAAKRLREDSRPVDVVQNDLGKRLGRDHSLDLLTGPLIRRRARLTAPPWFGGWSAVEGFVSKGVERVEGWIDDRKHPYARIYSRSHYAASAFLAARIAALQPDARWVAEFSDPLSRDIGGGIRSGEVRPGSVRDAALAQIEAAGWSAPPPQRPARDKKAEENLFAWAEVLCYALADEIVFTNEAQRDLMLEACHDPALAARAHEVSVIRPHPVPDPGLYALDEDPADDGLVLEPGVVHIAYFGAFYDRRPPTPLLRAVAALPASDRERLRVQIFTPTHEDVAAKAVEHGVADVVRVHPPVPYLRMLALSRRMSVLLVMDAEPLESGAPNPFLPSKWSEYHGAGVPVWGMVEEGSPLSSRPLDLRSPTGHVTAAIQVFARLARGGLGRA